MRLSCPNCAAIYELSEDRLTPGGSHVQCSDCHTRWFARPPALAAPPPAPSIPASAVARERPSEDEIIARLETRASARGAAAPASTAPASDPIAFPGPTRPQPAPRAEPPAAAPSPASPAAPQPATPLRPRVDRPAATSAPAAPRPHPSRPGKGRLGFGLAVGLATLGLALYLGAESLADSAPATAPALESYAAGIDAARDWIQATFGSLRPAVPSEA
jgi:predicted Zn finger-like uncharacterized protein